MVWKTLEAKHKYQNDWYAKNKEKRKPVIRENLYKRRKVLQDNIIAYLLKHPCVDCGEKDIIVLEFDHLRDKKKGIAHLVKDVVRWNTIAEEIEKCEVVCANCHAKRTAKRAGYYKVAFLAQW